MAQRLESPQTPAAIRDDCIDAVGLLMADHEAVRSMFCDYDGLIDDNASFEEKRELALLICAEIWIHTRIEKEIFYPVVRDALADPGLVEEAEVEHATAEDLIVQIEDMDVADEKYDAKVRVLGKFFSQHADEEEQEMFRRAEQADIDLMRLGIELAVRQMALKSELALIPDEENNACQDEAGARQRY